jgi:threonine/homoserine/homoserine lactone efflux protein
MNLQILPLAITMMAGPQIMSAIIFVTAPKALKVSVPFLAGVTIATTVGVIITTTIASLLSLGDPSESGSSGNIIQYVLVGLLVILAVKNYVGRETAEPPRWLGALQQADAKRAFMTGLLVILLMPSDLIIMLTVGTNLAQNNAGLVAALPFIGRPYWWRHSRCCSSCCSTGARRRSCQRCATG